VLATPVAPAQPVTMTLDATPGPAVPAALPLEPAGRRAAVASYADAVARGAPAVVNISTRRVVLERQVPEQFALLFPDWPEFRRREESSRGSGVILDAAEWRWLRERTDSPWYPTMRLFRQRQRGDWDSVFQAVEQALRERSCG